MSTDFREAVGRLNRIPGVQGAILVDREDGIPVEADAMDHIRVPIAAALTAQLFRRASRSAEAARFRELRSLQLQAQRGNVFAAAAGPLLVVVVTDQDANIGLVRTEVARLAQELAAV